MGDALDITPNVVPEDIDQDGNMLALLATTPIQAWR